MSSSNFGCLSHRVVYFVVADVAREPMREWLERVIKGPQTHAIHWVFIRLSLPLAAAPGSDGLDPHLMVDPPCCRRTIVEALEMLWNHWITNYYGVSVNPVLIFMPIHSAGSKREPWLCFSNNNLPPFFVPISVFTAILEASTAGFQRMHFHSCDAAFALFQITEKIFVDGGDGIGGHEGPTVTVTAFNGIEWSSNNVTEGPTAASNYLKAGAPFSAKAKSVATNMIIRFEIKIIRKVAPRDIIQTRSGVNAFELITVKKNVVGPSVGRVVDWSQSASENRLNAQEFRRFVTTPALLTKLGRLHKGDEIRVVWAYKSSTHKKFEWTAKVKGRKSSGDVIVVYDDNDREVIPYPQNSEYVLIDVINENDVE